MGVLQNIRNYWFPTVSPLSGTNLRPEQSYRTEDPKHLRRYIAPVQIQRLRTDIMMWREAMTEAEQAFYKHRVRMQRIFRDTLLNGHVQACIQRRKNMTLLKEFAIYNPDGQINEETTKYFKNQQWFHELSNHILDANFFGFSLVNWSGIENDKLTDLEIIRRENISPDRLNVTSYVYSLSGFQFLEEPVLDWSLWVTTPSETGDSICGYGMFYKIAYYEIFLRNLMGWNADFTEMFAQPYRVGKTMKTEGVERDNLEKALREMGSSGYAIIDPADEISFLETALGGAGYRSYESFEKRCESKITKLILGHEDALASTPGKLGSQNQAAKDAMSEIEAIDNRFLSFIINDKFIPKMTKLGFNIPMGCYFAFSNDHELHEIKEREAEIGQKYATIAKTFHDSGFKVTPEWIEEKTGIKVVDAPLPISASPFAKNKSLSDKMRKHINKIYAHGKI